MLLPFLDATLHTGLNWANTCPCLTNQQRTRQVLACSLTFKMLVYLCSERSHQRALPLLNCILDYTEAFLLQSLPLLPFDQSSSTNRAPTSRQPDCTEIFLEPPSDDGK